MLTTEKIPGLGHEQEEVIYRVQLCTYHNAAGKKISQDEYKALLGKKVLDIHYKQKTVVFCRRSDKPGKVYLKSFDLTKTYHLNRSGYYCPVKEREMYILSFNLETNHIVSMVSRRTRAIKLRSFKTNFIRDNGYLMNVMIAQLLDEADRMVFFSGICHELGISYRNVVRFEKSQSMNSVQAIMCTFLLQRRGFNLDTFFETAKSNFTMSSLIYGLNVIKPGNGLDDVIKALVPCYSDEDFDLAKNDNYFGQLSDKDTRVKAVALMDLFGIGPTQLKSTKWGQLYETVYLLPHLKLLKDFGFSFDDLANRTYKEIETMTHVVEYHQLLGLKLDAYKVLNISQYKDEFDAIRMVARELLQEFSHFLPKSLKFAKKLNMSEVVFEPMHHYSDIMKYSRSGALRAPYLIVHKKKGKIGMVTFSRLNPTGPCQYRWKTTDQNLRDQVDKHIKHKMNKTKLMEYLDYSIRYPKIVLKEKLTESLNNLYDVEVL